MPSWAPQGGLGLMYRVGTVLETACGVGEFRCRDGTCIGNSSRCNQFVDCEDASDEMNCSEWYPLPEPSLGPARLLPLSSQPSSLPPLWAHRAATGPSSQPACLTPAPCLQAWAPLGFRERAVSGRCGQSPT